MRGGDLQILTQHTPYLTEDSAALWEYYEHLPLESRPERLIVFVLAVQILESSGAMTRKQFPILRRVLDVYTGALTAACLMPRWVFFNVHKYCWAYEANQARRACADPHAPVPALAEGIETARSTFDA